MTVLKSDIDYFKDAKELTGKPGWVWNITTGCVHGCSYCYARELLERRKSCANREGELIYPFGFQPTFRVKWLYDNFPGKPSIIGVTFLGDLFCDSHYFGIIKNRQGENLTMTYKRDYVIQEVFKVVKRQKKHHFLFLTKNPELMLEYTFPANAWAGVTVTNESDMHRLKVLKRVNAQHKWVSFEPYLFNNCIYPDQINWLDWLVVGAMTGSSKIYPNRDYFQHIITLADDQCIPIFVKNNALKVYPGLPVTKQYPEVMINV